MLLLAIVDDHVGQQRDELGSLFRRERRGLRRGQRERGVAAGLLNATAQLGSALGLAVTVPLVASAAPMTGYRLGFAAAAAIAVAGVLATLTVTRVRDRGSLRPWSPDSGGRARGPASTAPGRATQAAGSARLPALGGVVGEPTRPRFR